MSEITIETVFWLFGLILSAIAASFPQALIRILGGGRVHPSQGTFLFLRIVAGFCFFGMIYRLFAIHQR
jgi:Na+-driven multidrug efflux pump